MSKKCQKLNFFFKLPKKVFLFSKKLPKNFIFLKKKEHFWQFKKEKKGNFWQLCSKECKVFGNFLTFKWQFSRGSGVGVNSQIVIVLHTGMCYDNNALSSWNIFYPIFI